MTPPTIGRVVHYVARGSLDGKFLPVPRMAHVTEVADVEADDPEHPTVGLCIVNPTGVFFQSLSDGGCRYDADGAPGTWHWPPRVGA